MESWTLGFVPQLENLIHTDICNYANDSNPAVEQYVVWLTSCFKIVAFAFCYFIIIIQETSIRLRC